MRRTIFSRIAVFKRRKPFLFWLIAATILVYILGGVYAPWEWGRIGESDLVDRILFSGIGEMFWIIHDISAFAEVYQDTDVGFVGMLVFALFSWMVFIKNMVLGHFERYDDSFSFGRVVRDYLFDIIFSYISALVCYATVPIFLAVSGYEPGSTRGWIIYCVVFFVLCFFPSLVTFARLGLIMLVINIFSNEFAALVGHARFSVFPLNILSSFLSGAVIFLIGLILDVLCTCIIKLAIKKCEDIFERGRILEIFYKMT